MFQLLQNEGMGDWNLINSHAERVDAVTADDIQRVAKQYLNKETRAVGVFTRKAEEPGTATAGDAEIEALPEQARPMVKQALSQLKAETDAAKIRTRLDQMRAQADQVPPQMKPIFDLIAKKAEERIAEIEKGKK